MHRDQIQNSKSNFKNYFKKFSKLKIVIFNVVQYLLNEHGINDNDVV